MGLQKIAIDEKSALEIISHEAIIRQAYKDSKGIWTWGPGITSASGHSVERYIGNPQPMERVLEVFLWLLNTKYVPDVLQAFEGVTLTRAQFTAAVSFHWNTGAIKRASWVKSFKEGKKLLAFEQFLLYKRPPEIIARRKRERDLFFENKWHNDGRATEFTQVNRKGYPVWSSAKKVDVRPMLKKLMAPQTTNLPVHPTPVALLAAPTYNRPSAWERLKAWFSRLFSRK
jgi:GH24 family phage-related lysozyme (muramidase)